MNFAQTFFNPRQYPRRRLELSSVLKLGSEFSREKDVPSRDKTRERLRYPEHSRWSGLAGPQGAEGQA